MVSQMPATFDLSDFCSIFLSKTKKIGFGYWIQAGNILCQNSPKTTCYESLPSAILRPTSIYNGL